MTTVSTNFVGYVFEDKAGNLWSSEGDANRSEMTLSRYDGRSFAKTVIASDQQIFGVIEDKAGNIWFGTTDGVRRYDGKSVANFSEPCGKQGTAWWPLRCTP
jgi:ligand-binding sensor domain-containing protein